jgi:HPt (histidine-containing phosphotransfer) domain-containing protein
LAACRLKYGQAAAIRRRISPEVPPLNHACVRAGGLYRAFGAARQIAQEGESVVVAEAALISKEAPIIDRAHLQRMTAGALELERELLRLFDTQCAVLMDRMAQCAPSARAGLAHALKGSALGIGAMRVAQAAAALEVADEQQTAALVRLNAAVQEARVSIARMLACAAE